MGIATIILDAVEAKIVEHKLDVPSGRRRDPRWLLRNLRIRNSAYKHLDEVEDLCIAAIDSLEG